MSPVQQNDPTALDQTFKHKSDEYEYTIPWTTLGPHDAQPLVFVHGTPWSSKSWKALALAFSTKYKVYLFDRPEFGQTPERRSLTTQKPKDRRTELDADLKGQAEAFAALFKSWNFEKLPHVVAHDNAGLVTLRAHLQHGCKYASLCLIDVVAVGPFGTPFFKTVAQGLDTYQAIPQNMFKGFIRAYIEGATYKPLAEDVMEMLMEPYSEKGVQGQEGFIREMEQAHYRDAEDVMGRYAEVGNAMPVKVIWGKNDEWIPYEKGVKLGEMIGTKTVVLVEEAGHLIMYDQPERLAIELAWWLSSQQK